MSIPLPNEQSDYYWKLKLRDGRIVEIPPRGVEIVKRKMDARQPIHTSDGSIPFAQIETFERSSRRFTDTRTLEQVAQAFKEPLVTDDGAVKARWVKKNMTRGEYDKQKGRHYRRIGEDGDMIVVAFVIPTHMVDTSYMTYCTKEEEMMLERQ